MNSTRDATNCEATREFASILWNQKVLLSHSQELFTCPYPEPEKSSPHQDVKFCEDIKSYSYNRQWKPIEL
jgi:hypothetical protein